MCRVFRECWFCRRKNSTRKSTEVGSRKGRSIFSLSTNSCMTSGNPPACADFTFFIYKTRSFLQNINFQNFNKYVLQKEFCAQIDLVIFKLDRYFSVGFSALLIPKVHFDSLRNASKLTGITLPPFRMGMFHETHFGKF